MRLFLLRRLGFFLLRRFGLDWLGRFGDGYEGGRMALDRANEAITTAGDGFDVTRIVSGIAQGSAELVNCGVKTVFEIDKGIVAPDLLTKFVTGDDLARTFEKEQENLKWLSGQTYTSAALEQLICVCVHLKGSKGDSRPELRLRSHD